MKTFKWRWVTPLGKSNQYLWFIEQVGDIGRTWASIIKVNEFFYRIILINKERNSRLTIPELLTLEDAKLAVEKKLFDDGVINDGDVVEDYTEE